MSGSVLTPAQGSALRRPDPEAEAAAARLAGLDPPLFCRCGWHLWTLSPVWACWHCGWQLPVGFHAPACERFACIDGPVAHVCLYLLRVP
jgi:hypothetical protein